MFILKVHIQVEFIPVVKDEWALQILFGVRLSNISHLPKISLKKLGLLIFYFRDAGMFYTPNYLQTIFGFYLIPTIEFICKYNSKK
jgi:hypothetical protein